MSKENKSQTFQFNFFRMLENYFLAGIATVFPLLITVYIIFVLFRFINTYVGKYVNSYFLETYGYDIPGLGLLVTFVIIIAIGILSSHYIGRKLFPVFEKVFAKIPFISEIYPSAKQLSDFLFSSDKKSKFKKVVMVEYPTSGSYSIGFVTNEEISDFNNAEGKELISVLVPLAPVPFSGLLLMLPRKKMKVLNISVNKAIKFVVSGGVVAPSLDGETKDKLKRL